MKDLTHRNADIHDAELLLKWANDFDVRNNAINQAQITWENHLKWFSDKLKNINYEFYIFLLDNIPIGQIRLDLQESYWAIDYSVDKKYRGLGYGKLMVKEIIEKFPERKFLAIVKNGNIQSLSVFRNLNFQEIEFFELEEVCFNKYVLEERR
jgi:UDP-2,4-diacetamido-2,4,6-trideoxy-beta-L-altropyranose hydrolase